MDNEEVSDTELNLSILMGGMPTIARILSHPLVQRLRCIKQAGHAYALDPRATHVRFDHSLGAARLATVVMETLSRKHPELCITRQEREVVVVAALLHDVGHGPCSHAFDLYLRTHLTGNERVLDELDEFDQFDQFDQFHEFHEMHEERGCRLIQQEFRDLDTFVLTDTQWGMVQSIICPSVYSWPSSTSPERGDLLRSVVNAPDETRLDVDRLDYLWRDSAALSALGPPILHPSVDVSSIDPMRVCGQVDLTSDRRSIQFPVQATRQWLIQRRWFHDNIAGHGSVREMEDLYMRRMDERIGAHRLLSILRSPKLWISFDDAAVEEDTSWDT